MSDPQAAEDEHIRRIRKRVVGRADEPATDHRELVRQWHGWAANCVMRARVERDKGDEFAADLLLARAGIREAAASLLLSHERTEAGRLMMVKAGEHVVRNPPLIGYDAAAIEYTIARTWQACAHQVDPSLGEVQSRWDG